MQSLEHDRFIETLKTLEGKHVAFFPKSGNAGDGFIAYATYTLFEKYNISYTSYSQDEKVDDKIVIIGGGGNLIEGKYEDVAKIIWRHRKNERIILLPHTVVGYKEIIAETHNNLEIFCREPVSYELILLNGANENKTHLSHDVTFYLDDEHFSELFEKGEGVLFALRTDGESSKNIAISDENIDLSLSWNGDYWKNPKFCYYATLSMASYIQSYESVLTDRLHISILSAFLKKNVIMMPNDYYKNQAIYEHSMKARFLNLKFINSSSSLANDTNSFKHSLKECGKDSQTIKNQQEEIDRLTEVLKDSQASLAEQMALRENSERKLQIKLNDWEEQFEAAEINHSANEARIRAELGGQLVHKTNLGQILQNTPNELEINNLRKELEISNGRLSEIFGSTTWKLMTKINIIASKLPKFVRKTFRKTFK